jgi:hypothetical protein
MFFDTEFTQMALSQFAIQNAKPKAKPYKISDGEGYIYDFGNLNLLDAVFAHNPALYVAKVVSMKVLSRVLGGQRDPLENLSKAFKNVSQYLGDAKPPQDVPTLALPPRQAGRSIAGQFRRADQAPAHRRHQHPNEFREATSA